MRELGDFVLERPLGSGATAQVYLGVRKSNPAARFALKVFHPGVWDQADLKRRVIGEFRVVSALRHPNIVQVHELLEGERPAVVMEHVDGVSLEEFQARLPYVLPEISAVIVRDILSALEHAHSAGIVHRDLKPANILVRADGRVYVSDFGLAKMRDRSRLTLSGTVLGSPDFMAPEQARGEPCTPRSDVFAAGSLLYFLVTGTRPFARATPLATLAAVTEARPEPPRRRNPKLSPALEAVILRAMHADAAGRFESAAAFRAAIEGHLVFAGVADLGLPAWIHSPADSTLAALQAMSETLQARAEKELAQGNWERATAIAANLGLVAPESAAIERILVGASGARARGRAKRSAAWVAAAAVLFALGVLSWRSLGPSPAAKETLAKTIAPVAAAPGRPTAKAISPLETGSAEAPAGAPETPVSAPRATALEPALAKPVPSRKEVDWLASSRSAPEGATAPAEAPGSTSRPEARRPTSRAEAPGSIARPTARAKSARPPAARVARGLVRFDVPPGVEVFWDGHPVDPLKPLFGQRLGEHELKLVKSGSPPIGQKVQVLGGEPTEIRVR